MRIALDTNILIYLAGPLEDERRDKSADLLRHLPPQQILLPVQVLSEYFRVLIRKQGYPASEAREKLIVWIESFATIDTTSDILVAAADIALTDQISHWDAVVLASATSAGCRILISEDMRDGFTWAGTTVVDPFASPRHHLLEQALQS